MRKKSPTLVCRHFMSLTTKTLVVPAYDLPRGRAVEVAEVAAAAEALQAAQALGGRSLLIILSVSICRAAAEPADARRRAADRGEYRQAAGDSCGSTPANARLRATQGHLQPSCRVPCKQPSKRRL